MIEQKNSKYYLKIVFRTLIIGLILVLSTVHSNAINQADQLLVQHITLEDGLPNSKVNAIEQDRNGFMWFGTNDGVCRYDGFNLRFYELDHFKNAESRTPQISTIKKDTSGNLLIGSYTLFEYDYLNDQIKRCRVKNDQNTTAQIGRVHAIEIGPQGLFYIGAENGLYMYDPAAKEAILLSNKLHDRNFILSLYSDAIQLWIGTKEAKLYRYSFDQKKIIPISAYQLSSEQQNRILCFYKFNDQMLWMGTHNSGLIKLNLSDSTISVVQPDVRVDYSLRVRKIIKDNYGDIWLGTRAGLYQYNNGHFKHRAYQGHPVSNMTNSSIYDLFIDKHNTMWAGTYSGGVNYIHFNRKPFHVEMPGKNSSGFEQSNINCLAEDSKSNLWIGTESLGLICKNGQSGRFEKYGSIHSKEHPNLSKSIKTIAVDSYDNVWIGTYSGLTCIDQRSSQIKTYTSNNSSLSSNEIRSIQIDKNQHVWIGTQNGLNYFHPDSETFEIFYSELEIHPVYIDKEQTVWFGNSPEGIYRKKVDQDKFEKVYREYFNSFIRCILVDSRKNLWIGNNKGLFYIDQKNNELMSYGLSEGLPSLQINGLLEDENQNLWISTGAGLLKGNKAIENPANTEFNRFSINDGLQGQLFRINAYYKNTNGDMYFGGDNGYNKVVPEEIQSDINTPEIAFTSFEIFNKTVEIGEEIDDHLVLPKAINELQSIDLSYKHRLFTLKFAALHYTNPQNNQYRYRLIPFQKEWVYSNGSHNFASYSNLKGGNYTFELEVANCDNIWNTNTRKLQIKINPPFWTTPWFIACAILLFLGLAVSLFLSRVSRLKRNNLQLEKMVAIRTKELENSVSQLINKQQVIEEQTQTLNFQKDQLQELNSTKDKFFTIIAHDLKNPFNSIMGMANLLDKKLKENSLTEAQRYTKIILDSTKHLYNLLENLLAWARSQTQRISFHPQPLLISDHIKDAIQLYKKNISDKRLTVNFENISENKVNADHNMIDSVVRNLLSNAIKFTPIDGNIDISIKKLPQKLEVRFVDNGIGIPENKIDKLFHVDEYKSRPGTEGEIGTGLGLMLCNEFINKHQGQIWAESNEINGSTFIFVIPYDIN